MPSGTYTIQTNGSAVATYNNGTPVIKNTTNAAAFDRFIYQTQVSESAQFVYNSPIAIATQQPILRDANTPDPQIRTQDPINPTESATQEMVVQDKQETTIQDKQETFTITKQEDFFIQEIPAIQETILNKPIRTF